MIRDNPNILEIYDYSGEAQATAEEQATSLSEVFLVSEFVEGVTLRDFAEQYPLADVPELGGMIIWQLTLALSHAHKQGVIHRDLKPENIMVRRDGTIKLMDFGIARATESNQLTVTGTLLGSPSHMAPEILDGKVADELSDLFSVGTIMYWLCTGKLPFDAPTPHALLKAIAENRYIPPQHISPRIPDGLATIIQKCLKTTPQERYESAKILSDTLCQYLDDWGVRCTVNGLSEALREPEHAIKDISENVRKKAMMQAEQALESGQTQKALAKVSRVLADAPQDEEAQKLLELLELQGRKPRWQLWLLTLVPLFLIAIPIGMHLYGIEKTPRPQSDALSPKAASPIPDIAQISSEQKIETAQPKLPASTPPTAKPVIKKNIKRNITIRATPWADIFLDGKKVASAQKDELRLRLRPGKHRLTFKHTYAATVTKNIIVKRRGGKSDYAIRFKKMKPALLMINGPANADIAVNGQYKGTVLQSRKRPIVVPLPDEKSHQKMEITLTLKDHKPKTLVEEMVAGQITSLGVTLTPKGNE